MSKTISKDYFDDFAKTEKVGLVATIDECGDPHITIMSTIMAGDENTILVGQFSQGFCKKNMMERKKTGFAIMSLKLNFWFGTFDWKDVKTEGPEFERYNKMQMFRFNTYFGVEKVHYGNLVEISEKERLRLGGILGNYLKVGMKKKKYLNSDKNIMRPFAQKLFNGLVNPKFCTFINKDGYPIIVPVMQAQSAGSDRVVFTAKPYAERFGDLKKGDRVAIICMSLNLESVVVKGTFSGFDKGVGYIDIDRVYNSMLPVTGYIYPPQKHEAVEEF